MRMVRLPELIKKTGLKRATIYKKIKQGLFPAPVKIGPKTSVWVESEVDRVLHSYISGADEEQIKQVVSEILRSRKS